MWKILLHLHINQNQMMMMIFFYFPENYSRRVRKSTNKKILALEWEFKGDFPAYAISTKMS